MNKAKPKLARSPSRFRPFRARSFGGTSRRPGVSEENRVGRIENAIFCLLFALTDKSGSNKRSALHDVYIPNAFSFIDFILILDFSTKFGWDSSVTLFIKTLAEIIDIEWSSSQTFYSLTFWVAVLFLTVILALSVFIGYTFSINKVQVLPLRVLRFLVSLLLSALYIPTLKIFMMELSITGPHPHSHFYTPNSTSLLWLLHAILSVFFLLVIVPFCLLIGLIYHDLSPNSPDVEACATGRVTFLYTALRTILVISYPFMDGLSFAIMLFVLLFLMTLMQTLCMPFYKLRTNQMRAGMLTCGTYFALVSLILGCIYPPNTHTTSSTTAETSSLGTKGGGSPSSPSSSSSTTWAYTDDYSVSNESKDEQTLRIASAVALVASLIFFWLGARLTRAWFKVLERKTRNLQEGSVRGKGAWALPRTITITPRGGATKTPGKPESYGEMEAIADVWRMTKVFFSSRKRFWSALEVELSARYASSFTFAEELYRAGICDFPWASYVRLHFVLFLDCKKHTQSQAAEQMREAWKQNPPFDIRFALRAKSREWEHQTHSQNLGDGEVNYLNVLEYKNLHTEATLYHNTTIMLLRSFWKTLSNPRVSIQQLLAVPKGMEEIDQAKGAASRAYRALLQKFPNSKSMLRAYGMFLEVCNDQDSAQTHFAAAEEIEEAQMLEAEEKRRGKHDETRQAEGEGGGEATSGALVPGKSGKRGKTLGSESSRASALSSSVAARKLSESSKVVNNEVAAVRILSYGMIGGLALVAVVSSTYYMVVSSLEKSFQYSIQRIVEASNQMRRLVEFSFIVRSMSLSAVANDQSSFDGWKGELIDTLELFTKSHHGLFLGFTEIDCPPSASIQTIFSQRIVPLVLPLQTSSSYSATHNLDSLWNAGNFIIGQVEEVIFKGSSDTGLVGFTDAMNTPAYRYILLNSVDGILSVASKVSDLAAEDVRDSVALSQKVLAGLLAASIVVLVALSLLLFRPAFNKVRSTMRGVTDIILHMPLRLRKKLYDKHMSIALLEMSDSEGFFDEDAYEDEDSSPNPKANKEGKGAEEDVVEDVSAAEPVVVPLLQSPKRNIRHPPAITSSLSILDAEEEDGGVAERGTGMNDKDKAKQDTTRQAETAVVSSSSDSTMTTKKPSEARRKFSRSDLENAHIRGSLRSMRRSSLQGSVDEAAGTVAPPHDDRVKRVRSGSSSFGADDPPQPRRKSLDSIGTVTDKNDIVSILSRRSTMALILIALTSSVNFVVCFLFLSSTQSYSQFINFSGKRFDLSTRVILYARELFINDGIIAGKQVLAQRLESAVWELRHVHTALTQGNETLGLPTGIARQGAQDFLLYKETCLHTLPEDCKPNAIASMPIITNGLDYLIQVMVDRVLVVLQDHDFFGSDGLRNATSAANNLPPQPNYDLSSFRVRNVSSALCDLLDVDEEGSMDESGTYSTLLYTRVAQEKLKLVLSADAGLLAFNLVFLSGLYFFLFRPLVKRLRTECNRTSQFVAMLPKEVLQKVDVLKKYLGESEDLEREGTLR